MAHSGGRLVAWAGFGFGSFLSISANVLYTWIPHPPEGAPENWTPPTNWAPSVAAQIGAAAWPIALLLSVEILSRVRWRDGWLWKLARYGGAGVVALGSAVISYGHLNHVLTEWNYGTLGSAVGPLVIDGLMTVSGFALLAMGGDAANSAPAESRSTERPAPRLRPPQDAAPPAVAAPNTDTSRARPASRPLTQGEPDAPTSDVDELAARRAREAAKKRRQRAAKRAAMQAEAVGDE